MSANKQQIEFWSGGGGDYWVDKQFEMDTMLNPLGQKVEEYFPNSSGWNNQLDVSNYDSGWYILDFEFENGLVRKKILKQ